MTTTNYTPAEVFPPGEYLRDELDERGWTATEFAEIIGRPVQVVSEILNGKKEITTETALAFGDALGTSAALWLNLQTNYRISRRDAGGVAGARVSSIARRARLRGLVPVAELRRRGWLPDTDDLDQLEKQVCQLLGIELLDQQPQFAIAARRSNSHEGLTIEQIAWLGRVRSIAAQRTSVRFRRARLATLAAKLPRLLQDGPAEGAMLESWFAECGVILVVVEGLKGGKLDGAVSFLDDGRPVIGLTARGDRFDGLLFTLLHECAHLTLGHLVSGDPAWVDDNLTDQQTDPIEIAANAQAAEWLFPGGFEIGSTNIASIVETASRYGVHPSVVIGRVQRDTGQWSLHRRHIPKVRAVLMAGPKASQT